MFGKVSFEKLRQDFMDYLFSISDKREFLKGGRESLKRGGIIL